LGLSNYTARFTNFDAKVEFDPQQLEQSKVTATIDPSSIKTNYPYPQKKDFDKKLVEGTEWFNVATFPSITFTSMGVKLTGDNTAIMTGDLTFLGACRT